MWPTNCSRTRKAQFINDRYRPDIVVLPETTTWQMTGIESFDPADTTLTQMQQILVIELKKSGFELTRKEVNQADGYVQDITKSGAMSGTLYICAWVVGQKIAAGVEREKRLGSNPEYGRVRATTFGSLVDTANARLLNLRSVLAARYEGIDTDQLLNRVLSQPVQEGMAFSSNGPTAKPEATDG